MEPLEKDELMARIGKALDTVRPFLHTDGGDVELLDLTEEMVVELRLVGSCSSCSMSHMTMKAGIEDSIKQAVPEVRSVVAVA